MNASKDEYLNKPSRNPAGVNPELDLSKLVNRRVDDSADQDAGSASLQSDAAKSPQHPVEAPATSYPDQGDSIADMADKANARSKQGE